MPIIASEKGGAEFKQISAGPVNAVCYDMWDIGIQKGEYQGKQTLTHKVVVGFEVDELLTEGEFAGKRMTINQFFTLSLGAKSKLKPFLESWLGKTFSPEELKGFDIERIIGMSCILNIVHNDKGKAKISGVSPLMKNMLPMKPENKRSMPKWIVELVNKSVKADIDPDDAAIEASERDGGV